MRMRVRAYVCARMYLSATNLCLAAQVFQSLKAVHQFKNKIVGEAI